MKGIPAFILADLFSSNIRGHLSQLRFFLLNPLESIWSVRPATEMYNASSDKPGSEQHGEQGKLLMFTASSLLSAFPPVNRSRLF